MKGREYWYYNGYDPRTGTKLKKYVGPKSDPDVTQRVENFGAIKQAYQARLEAVRMLKAAGLPVPDPMSGALLDALSRAGFFRLRGVLIGTIAFQTYPGLVGARPERYLNTGDIDLAQDYGISIAVDDASTPLLDAVRQVDPTFRLKPGLNKTQSTAFVSARGYQIDFLVPNRGSDDNQGSPVPLPALGVGAVPLRYLDFLIRHPVRSVALHSAGVAVVVPAPERYAIHKLIVATQRQNREKMPKDIGQAEFLIAALGRFQFASLGQAWQEAWERGPNWREALVSGRELLREDSRNELAHALRRYCEDAKLNPETLGLSP